MATRIATLSVSLLLTAAPPLTAQPGAGSIDSITPAAAHVGDLVTITGRGFGARNVTIQVGDVPARVVNATGNRVTFVVPDSAIAGSTQVTARNPGGHTGAIGFQVLLTVGLDESHALVARVGIEGAVLRARSGDLIYTLTVPPGALGSEETIAVTPVASIPNLPLTGGLAGAVRFAPEGLSFFVPAHLTIARTGGFGPDPPLGFTAPDDGGTLHLLPVTTTGTTIEMLVSHFSVAGAAFPGPGALPVPAPATVHGRAQHDIARLSNQLASGSIDVATFEAEMLLVLRRWFSGSVEPRLTAAAADDDLFFDSDAVSELMAWVYYTETLGVTPQPELQVGFDLFLAGARNGVARSNQRCLSTHTPSPFVERQMSVWYLAETGLFEFSSTWPIIDLSEFSDEELTARLCVQPLVTAISLGSSVPAGQPTPVSVDAGAYFADGTPVQPPFNVIDVFARAFGEFEPGLPIVGDSSTFSPSDGALAGPDVFATILTVDSRAVGVQVEAKAAWRNWLLAVPGPTHSVGACVPQRVRAGGQCRLPIGITVAPQNPVVRPGDTIVFTATVTGGSSGVIFTALGGTIVPTGNFTAVYTAGSVGGIYGVTATSVDDPSQSQTVAVVINVPQILEMTFQCSDRQVLFDVVGGPFGYQGPLPYEFSFALDDGLTFIRWRTTSEYPLGILEGFAVSNGQNGRHAAALTVRDPNTGRMFQGTWVWEFLMFTFDPEQPPIQIQRLRSGPCQDGYVFTP